MISPPEFSCCNIYGLYDPREENEVRYVGKTILGIQERKNQHIQETKTMNEKSFTPKNEWIKCLLLEEIEPSVKLIEKCRVLNWDTEERYWIKKLRMDGHRLTNINPGGIVSLLRADLRYTPRYSKEKMQQDKKFIEEIYYSYLQKQNIYTEEDSKIIDSLIETLV